MSIFDWVASLLAAYVIGRWILGLRGPFNWALFFTAWTLFGVAVHWVAGVPTQLGYYLSLNKPPARTLCV